MKSPFPGMDPYLSGASDYSADDHERLLIRAFFLPHRRDRFLSFLKSSSGRKKLRSALPHLKALDPRFLHRVPSGVQSPRQILALLTAKGAPDQCHVISGDILLDGTQKKLLEALEAVIGYGAGALISCLPGRLAYFEEEGPSERYVLERGDGAK